MVLSDSSDNSLGVSGVLDITTSVSGAVSDGSQGFYDVLSGTSFSITCDLSCPTTTLTWSQNQVDISNSSSNTVTLDGFSVNYTIDGGYVRQSVLTKPVAITTDTATYRCFTIVQDQLAFDESAIFVRGKGKFCVT